MMKSKYKYLVNAALSTMLGVLVAFSAGAQHRGGGGGGSRGGGGGGFHGSPGGGSGSRSGGGGSFGGRSGGGYSGGSRMSPGAGSYSRGNSGSYSRGNSGSFNRGGQAYQRPSGGNSSPRLGTQSYRGGGQQPGVSSRGGQRYSYNAPSRGYNGRGPVVSGRAYGNGYRGNVYSRGGAYNRGGLYNRGSVYNRGFYNRGGYYNHGRYYSGRSPFYGRYTFYNRYYLPRLGFSLSVLPFGYYPFYWGDYQYYYSGGYYYQYNDNNYTVVEPPLGAILGQLPSDAKSLMIDGEQYYELNGVYYQAVTQDDGTTGYQIAGKDGELSTGNTSQPQGAYDSNAAPDDQGPLKIGDLFETLPADCTTVKIDGQKYYVSPDGVYYQEDKDNGQKVYRVAGTPDDQPGK